MYQSHYGLNELPFGLTPDTSFVYTSPTHQEALNTLLIAARNGEGFIKITGEVGTGKTLLCRTFLAALGDAFVSAYILNPYVDPRSLLHAVADELSVPIEPHYDQHQMMKSLMQKLLELAAAGKQVVICIDEAQAMPLESLEALRLFTNFETEKTRLLQVVLFGQPELDTRLAHPSVRQLRQRITFQYCLRALTPLELQHYLAHRMQVAGHRGKNMFSEPAAHALHKASGGIPRLINIIAHKAMLLAYGEGVHEITRAHLRAAVSDTPAARVRRGWWPGFRQTRTA
jgi:MSHA biogenesis protein MshM